jgi:MFS family permease
MSALRYPQFLKHSVGNFLFTIAILIQETLIGYELYKITKNPFYLGLIGLAEALPYISLALFGGLLADRKAKRNIMLSAQAVIIGISVLFIVLFQNRLALGNTYFLGLLFAGISFIGFARGFYSPASSSIKALLTPKTVYSNAASWSASFWQLGRVIGPASAGWLYIYFGLSGALWLVVGLFLLNELILFSLKVIEITSPKTEHFSLKESILEGLKFVFGTKIMLYSISLDLVAVLFGGVIAILPVFAEDILKVGPSGLGYLRAAPSVGAVITILITTKYSPNHKAWQNMLIAVLGFGICTLAFALSKNFYFSVLMLGLTGVFDSISVVVRQSILQIIPPDHLRGRVSAVNSIFVASSNEIGAFESGLAASLFGTVPSVVGGAVLVILISGLVYAKTRELFGFNLATYKSPSE